MDDSDDWIVREPAADSMAKKRIAIITDSRQQCHYNHIFDAAPCNSNDEESAW